MRSLIPFRLVGLVFLIAALGAGCKNQSRQSETYLHHLPWELDPEGFKDRLEKYLSIADNNDIATLFVFFDDCWNPTYKAGRQPDPKPGIHNSGWVCDPGDLLYADSSMRATLERYVKDVLTHFRDDERIVLWDLYNEPGNSGYENKSMPLLKEVFQWAREINYGRPLICTEYMARTRNSRFEEIMPLLKDENIAAYNWGLVSGKSNTIYAWNAPMPDGQEPKVRFHDIFRKDGTPYDVQEVRLIKELSYAEEEPSPTR